MIQCCPWCNSSVTRLYKEYDTGILDESGHRVILPCVPSYCCDNFRCDFCFIEPEDLEMIESYLENKYEREIK